MELNERIQRIRADILCVLADYEISRDELYIIAYNLWEEAEKNPGKFYREILSKMD